MNVDRTIERVRAFIERNGIQVNWYRPVSTPNASQPWKPGAASRETFTPFVIILPPRQKLAEVIAAITGANIQQDITRLLIAPQTFSFEPQRGDVVATPRANITVTGIIPLEPTGVPLLYDCGASA